VKRYDAVIVGAGVAGLAAAQRLLARGRSVAVLEARNRIGGRIWTTHVPELTSPIELGAEFLHADARESRTLARRAGLTVVDIGGERWMSREGELRRAPGFEKRVERLLGRFRDDLEDDRSVADALGAMRSLKSEDKLLATRFVEGFHAADTDRISEQSLAGSADDPDTMRIARVGGGYDQLVNALAESSRKHVHLDHVVSRITWRRGDAVITSRSSSGSAHADIGTQNVVVTVPLGVLQAARDSKGAVGFDPPVPSVEAAVQGLVMGGVFRIAIRFDAPFWTLSRFSKRHGDGQFKDMSFVQSLEPLPFPVWWTTYPLEAPLLVGWSGGPNAWKLTGKTPDEISDNAVRSLARVFGMTRQSVERHVLAVFTHDWLTDPYSRGAYSYVAVGGSAASAVLARPIERTLYFAGEHASTGRNGTVDGAISSGFRAAGQLLRNAPG
jgi:monoamine oxidase